MKDEPRRSRVRRLDAFERACALLMMGGILARCLTFLYSSSVEDPAVLTQMGSSFVRYHEFVVPYAEGWEYSHHFPPLFPLYLAAWIAVFGAHLFVVQMASLALAVGFIAVTFACTRDLYGRSRAFAVAALAAVFPMLVLLDQTLSSETFVATLFALTIWAILKSLDRPAFVVWAGLFAGLSFLVKASMGPFFVLAGAGGFAWRFYYVRWRIFSDRHYLLAAAIFGAIVVAWSARNVARFGWPHYETQPHATEAFSALWNAPNWPIVLAQQFLWLAFLVLLFMGPWLPQVRASIRELRDQRVSALWMAIVTPAFVAVFFVAAFSVLEHYGGVLTATGPRYLTAPVVPILWLSLRNVPLDAPAKLTERAPAARRHAILFGAGVACFAAIIAFYPAYYYLDAGRVFFIFAVIALGAALLALSTFFLWERETRGRGVVRAVHHPHAGRYALFGIGAVALVFLLSTTLWLESIVYTLPVTAAAFVASPRAKVLAVGVIFLAAGFAGSQQAEPLEGIAAAINERAAPGAIVGSDFNQSVIEWYEPYLRHDLVLTHNLSAADFLVEVRGAPTPANPRAGYHTVAALVMPHRPAPGTALEQRAEDALGVRFFPSPGVAYVYERNATGG